MRNKPNSRISAVKYSRTAAKQTKYLYKMDK